MRVAVYILVGVVAGIAVGYYIGRASSDGNEVVVASGGGPTVIGRVGVMGEGESVGTAWQSEGEMGESEWRAVMAGGRISLAQGNYEVREEFVRRMAKEDPKRAIAWVRENAEENEQDELLGVVTEEWAKVDGTAAFEWAASLGNVRERYDGVTGAIRGVMEAGNETLAMQMIEGLPNGELKDGALVAAVGVLAPKDLSRALEIGMMTADTYSTRRVGRVIGDRLLELGRIEQAKAMVVGMEFGGAQKQLAIGLAEALSEEDPRQAISWMAEQSDIFDANTVRNVSYRLAREFVEDDPLEAVAWAEQIPAGRARDYYYERLGDAWARMEPEVAGQWLMDAINENGFGVMNHLAEGVFDEWVEMNHDQPFEYIEKIRDEGARNGAMYAALNELAGENPAAAAERLGEWTPEDAGQSTRLASRLIGYWMRRDAIAASQWVNTLAPGQTKDAAIQSMLQTVLREDRDVEGARAWVNEVQSEDVRNNLLKEIERFDRPQAGGSIRFDRREIQENSVRTIFVEDGGVVRTVSVR
ncbi:MAG: hypothetical protein AAGD22_02600 [Verrucomicrobiota bacterium]